MNIELIRNNIVARRNKLGYSQEYVAVLLGISTNSYSKIENGHTAIISKRLFQIASALKTSVDELVLGENITLQEHQKICKELEEKYNKDIAYYRQHIDSCNLTIKTLQEATLEKESKIKELTAQIARLQKPENHSAADAGEMESNSAADAGGLAGQHPVTGAGELAGQHPVTGAGELAEQHPVTGEAGRGNFQTGAAEYVESHQADAGGLGNYPTGVAEFAVNPQAATAEMEDMTEPDDLPMNMAEPDGISRLV